MIYKFNPVLYPVKLWVIIGGDENVMSRRFKFTNDSPINISHENKDAMTLFVKEKRSDLFGVAVCFPKRETCNVKSIAHEASHGARLIWNWIGEDEIGEEAHCYLVGWVAECIEKARKWTSQ